MRIYLQLAKHKRLRMAHRFASVLAKNKNNEHLWTKKNTQIFGLNLHRLESELHDHHQPQSLLKEHRRKFETRNRNQSVLLAIMHGGKLSLHINPDKRIYNNKNINIDINIEYI